MKFDIVLGARSGVVLDAKWGTSDYEHNMDGMQMTAPPTRNRPNGFARCADICVPGNNACLIRAERGLARLADALAGARRGPQPPRPGIRRLPARRCLAPTHCWIASGLAAHGHCEIAADIADKTIANAIKKGIGETLNSVAGMALGIADYRMSSTLVAMMLVGLSRKHQLKLRDKATLPPAIARNRTICW